MSIEWKYKVDLHDRALEKISNKYGIKIPDDLVELLKKANGATPTKTKFMVKVDEKILGSILSFNLKESEADSFEVAMKIGFDRNIIPFGIDPFGNYICYDTNNGNIIFFDHEENLSTIITNSLKKFIDILYE
ncbi:MAG: SMI1/KNR4 family protein [Peptostreptococcus sp.]|jgi:hypothetical protein|nr:SMI1/KNR4 family protein [Peptostreptococcus sp.]